NIGSDLPFILRWGDQIADEDNQQIVINHRAVVVAVQAAAALLEHRGPKKHCAGQRNQAKQSAQKIIPAVNERVLQSNIKDREVFFDVSRAHKDDLVVSSTARSIAAIMLSARAIPLP